MSNYPIMVRHLKIKRVNHYDLKLLSNSVINANIYKLLGNIPVIPKVLKRFIKKIPTRINTIKFSIREYLSSI